MGWWRCVEGTRRCSQRLIPVLLTSQRSGFEPRCDKVFFQRRSLPGQPLCVLRSAVMCVQSQPLCLFIIRRYVCLKFYLWPEFSLGGKWQKRHWEFPVGGVSLARSHLAVSGNTRPPASNTILLIVSANTPKRSWPRPWLLQPESSYSVHTYYGNIFVCMMLIK